MEQEFTLEFIEKISERFKAFADPTRINILMYLMEHDKANVTTLSEYLEIKQASMSKHLAILKQTGVISLERVGNQSIYSIQDPSIHQLCELMCSGVKRHITNTNKALGLSD